ncbi:carbohydrate kinase [Aureococcus anophagefferens]|nr:carbohydrate kinase [Aureococcus anophagefferens]
MTPKSLRTLLAFAVLTRAQALAPPTAPPPSILSIGETLYDSLPNGVFLGGAPLNVAVHAAQLGAHSVYASAVGDDALGRDATRRLEAAGVDAPSAWDEVLATDLVVSVARSADCVVHGSLALRGEKTAATIRACAEAAPKRVFDVNLRPMPDGVSPSDVVEPLLENCWVLKMNEDELEEVAAWLGVGQGAPPDDKLLLLHDRLQAEHLVVTRAERGAALATKGGVVAAPGVAVDVADTVGSGDSFCARLVVGLLRGEAPEARRRDAPRVLGRDAAGGDAEARRGRDRRARVKGGA